MGRRQPRSVRGAWLCFVVVVVFASLQAWRCWDVGGVHAFIGCVTFHPHPLCQHLVMFALLPRIPVLRGPPLDFKPWVHRSRPAHTRRVSTTSNVEDLQQEVESPESKKAELNFLHVWLSYAQTTSRAALPGLNASLERYMSRPREQFLYDMAKGRGNWKVEEVDADAGRYLVTYPAGVWRAPRELGMVNLTGPILELLLEDVENDPPKALPKGAPLVWHQARCRVTGRITNGRQIAAASVRLPLLPPFFFNVSIAGDLELELSFGGNEHESQVVVGTQGELGLALPQFPGAGMLMSLFCPVYVRKAMQDAADGLSTRYKELGFS